MFLIIHRLVWIGIYAINIWTTNIFCKVGEIGLYSYVWGSNLKSPRVVELSQRIKEIDYANLIWQKLLGENDHVAELLVVWFANSFELSMCMAT